MEHPLIDSVAHLTIDQLQEKINDLTKKLAWAQRTNAHLAGQLRMALETYQNQYRIKQNELFDRQNRSGQDYSEKINIT